MKVSMLTGESQAVKKNAGDTLFAGTYIISGGCIAQVDKIGKESYIQMVAKEAKKFKSPQSDLFKDLVSGFRFKAEWLGGITYEENN